MSQKRLHQGSKARYDQKMDNVHTPKPGKWLQEVEQKYQELEQGLLLASQMDPEDITKAPPKVIQDYFLKIKANPSSVVDELKYILDKVEIRADEYTQKAGPIVASEQAFLGWILAVRHTLVETMKELKVEKLDGAQWSLQLKKSKPTLSIDPKILCERSPDYVLVKTVYEPNHDRIYEALKRGDKIEGAQIEENFDLEMVPKKKETHADKERLQAMH